MTASRDEPSHGCRVSTPRRARTQPPKRSRLREGHQARPGPLPRLGSGDLRRQVVHLVRRALHRLRAGPVRRRRGRSAAAVRAGPRTGLRHRLLPAQPHAGRRREDRFGHRPLAGHGQGRAAQRGAPRRSPSTAASPMPRPSRTRTTPSTSSSATRCCTTSRTSSSRCARCCACSSRAAGSSSPASPPPSATSTPAGSGARRGKRPRA